MNHHSNTQHMRKLMPVFIVCCLSAIASFGQTTTPPQDRHYFQISPRAGFDFPSFYNNTPYIDYKGGLELGLSLDYYWNWFGLGADVDYIKNKPRSIFPTSNLVDKNDVPLTNFNLLEQGITRIFYGVGPGFKYQTNDGKFSAELTGRVGLSHIRGGRTELWETSALTPQLLNFHAGYQIDQVLAGKGQVRLNYFFNRVLGVHLGAYYLRHFRAEELFDNTLGMSAGYQPIVLSDRDMNMISGNPVSRVEPCHCDIASIGVFAGVSIKIPPARAQAKTACNTCERYSLTVTARDKFTKEVLPNTDVVLKDLHGSVIRTATTNSYGVVVFDNVQPDNYGIEGALYEVKLDATAVAKSEFVPNQTIQKEILYSDLNFILKGKAVICNTANPLDNVSVILKNPEQAEQRSTMTNARGEFVFNIKQQSTYQIHGKKANYLSQVETVSTRDYNRSTTLFVKLEICMDDADCGKAITLRNIYYDLDKYFIREEAKKELDNLVQFMVDYPEVAIELYSHTDSRGSDDYNKKLSQNRANAAVDYVVSRGIQRNRLTGIGYGESRLLNRCSNGVECTETEHQLNRRTEVKVICPR